MKEPVSGTWDMEALRSHIQTQLTRIEALDVQRDDGLHKELDGRLSLLQLQLDQRQLQLDQRLHSLQELLTERDAALDRVLSQRIDDGERAIGAAMASAEQAVLKAEAASERRFESINEFRAALGDQQRNLLPRIEYDTAHTSLAERTTEMGERLAALELRLTSRLDTSSGRDLGSEGARSELRLDRASLLQLFTLLVIAAGVIFSIWHH